MPVVVALIKRRMDAATQFRITVCVCWLATTGALRRQEDESYVSNRVVQQPRVAVISSVYAEAPLTVAPVYATGGSNYDDTPLTQPTLDAVGVGGASSFYAVAPLTQPTLGGGSVDSVYADEPLTRAPAETVAVDGCDSAGYEVPLDDDVAVVYAVAVDGNTPSGPQVRILF